MRIVIIDASPVFREGLKRIVATIAGAEVAGEAARFTEIRNKIETHCDVLVMDGELEALMLLRELGGPRRRDRRPVVLIVSGHGDPYHVFKFLKSGADGYVPKWTALEAIAHAIRQVALGRKYVPPDVAEQLLLYTEGSEPPPRISDREHQVLTLLASGLSVSEIGNRLSLSVKTIST